MQRSRVEALLASFPKLADTGTQHTTVEQDNVRFVYQPLDELYMVLITNRQSNILQDIDSLHLFAQVVVSTCKTLDEREILKNAYELLSAFDELVTLVRVGVDVGRVSQTLYQSYPRRRIELLRALLGTMRFDAGGKVASFSLSLQTAAELGVQPEDNEGLIDHLRAIEGVIVAAFFEELPDGKVRVSLRSKSEAADVCAICQKFGGGGHTLAAGARVRGTLAEVEERVLDEICHVVNSNT
jgi:hypothetical protein